MLADAHKHNFSVIASRCSQQSCRSCLSGSLVSLEQSSECLAAASSARCLLWMQYDLFLYLLTRAIDFKATITLAMLPPTVKSTAGTHGHRAARPGPGAAFLSGCQCCSTHLWKLSGSALDQVPTQLVLAIVSPMESNHRAEDPTHGKFVLSEQQCRRHC